MTRKACPASAPGKPSGVRGRPAPLPAPRDRTSAAPSKETRSTFAMERLGRVRQDGAGQAARADAGAPAAGTRHVRHRGRGRQRPPPTAPPGHLPVVLVAVAGTPPGPLPPHAQLDPPGPPFPGPTP